MPDNTEMLAILQRIRRGQFHSAKTGTGTGTASSPQDLDMNLPVPPEPANGVYTFITMADTHALFEGQSIPWINYDTWLTTIQSVMGAANNVQSLVWPSWASHAGSSVEAPLFVTFNGDVIDGGYGGEQSQTDGQVQQALPFIIQNYSSWSLQLPCFVGLGNHDLDWESPANPHPFLASAMFDVIDIVHAGIWEYDPAQNVTAIDADYSNHIAFSFQQVSFNYILNFSDIVFVQLHRCGDDNKFDRPNGLDWVAGKLNDLDVGQTPVVIFQHYGWYPNDKGAWWTDEQRANTFRALAPYNVIGFFTGHAHGTIFTPPIMGGNFWDFCPGSAAQKDKDTNKVHFGIVRIDTQSNWMDVGVIDIDCTSGEFGFNPTWSYSKTIPDPTSVVWQSNSGYNIGPQSGVDWRTVSEIAAIGDGAIVAVKGGDLFWFKDLAQDGTVNWDTRSGSKITPSGWGTYSTICSAGNGTLFCVSGNQLYWFKLTGLDGFGNALWDENSGAVISNSGWSTITQLCGGSGGDTFYSLDAKQNLYWYRFDGFTQSGAPIWESNSGPPVGSGKSLITFNSQQTIGGGSGGVFFGFQPATPTSQEQLFLYINKNQDGSADWTTDSGNRVDNPSVWPQGVGGDTTVQVVVGEFGVVHRICTNGALYWLQCLTTT